MRQEAKFLSRIIRRRDIRQLIESFEESGPNGEHTFLVLEPTLCGVRDAKRRSYYRPLSLSIARRLIADLIVTVQSLHAEGVVHSGIFMQEKQSVLISVADVQFRYPYRKHLVTSSRGNQDNRCRHSV